MIKFYNSNEKIDSSIFYKVGVILIVDNYYYMFWNDNPPRKYSQIYNHIKKMSPIPIDPQINLPRECIIGPSPNAVIEKVPK